MSDYLEGLVARSFDAPGAIRPRPVALFETPGGEAVPVVTQAGGKEFAEPARAEPDADPARPEEPVVRAVPPGRPMQPVPPATEPSEPARRPLGRVRPPGPAAPRAEPLTVTEAPPVARAGESSVASPPVARPARLQDTPQTRRTTESRADPLPGPPSLREVRPAAIRPIRRALIGEPPVEASAAAPPTSGPLPRPAVAAADPEPRSTVAVPQAAPTTPHRPIDVPTIVPVPRVEGPDRDREGSTDPGPSPTIHVTIGRVEVRASLPPAAAARPRVAPPPVMSLDEYLKQRAAGEAHEH